MKKLKKTNSFTQKSQKLFQGMFTQISHWGAKIPIKGSWNRQKTAGRIEPYLRKIKNLRKNFEMIQKKILTDLERSVLPLGSTRKLVRKRDRIPIIPPQ